MAITFDPAKRDWTLRHRGLDFLAAERVFEGPDLPTDRRTAGLRGDPDRDDRPAEWPDDRGLLDAERR
jgi:hypothetical protein